VVLYQGAVFYGDGNDKRGGKVVVADFDLGLRRGDGEMIQAYFVYVEELEWIDEDADTDFRQSPSDWSVHYDKNRAIERGVMIVQGWQHQARRAGE